MESRNITFKLPTSLVQEAKVYAAENDTTINSLVRELLQEKLSRQRRVHMASRRLLAIAEKGPYFKTNPASITREELHERR